MKCGPPEDLALSFLCERLSGSLFSLRQVGVSARAPQGDSRTVRGPRGHGRGWCCCFLCSASNKKPFSFSPFFAHRRLLSMSPLGRSQVMRKPCAQLSDGLG